MGLERSHSEYIQFFCTRRWKFILEYNGDGFQLTAHKNNKSYQFGGTSLIDTLREAALFIESIEEED